jgi:EAL domain-containing protein (putative c-di-GMP-specific phosphodiesterase class I)
VMAIVQLARDLGKKTIAEFVGDHATIELLREYGVDFAQGFHIGMPRPVQEVLAPSAVLAS